MINLYSSVYTKQEHSNLPVPDHIHTTGTQCLNKLPERRKNGEITLSQQQVRMLEERRARQFIIIRRTLQTLPSVSPLQKREARQ